MGVNGGDVALEFRVLAGLAVHRLHGIQDFTATIGGTLLGLAKGGADELCLGRIEVLAKRLDEMNQVLLVPAGKRGAAAIPITLPPEKAGDLIFLGPGIILVEFRETPSLPEQYHRRIACRRTT